MTTHEPVNLQVAENAFWAASIECRQLAEIFDRLARRLRERNWTQAEELAPRVLESLHRIHDRIDEAGGLGATFA